MALNFITLFHRTGPVKCCLILPCHFSFESAKSIMMLYYYLVPQTVVWHRVYFYAPSPSPFPCFSPSSFGPHCDTHIYTYTHPHTHTHTHMYATPPPPPHVAYGNRNSSSLCVITHYVYESRFLPANKNKNNKKRE